MLNESYSFFSLLLFGVMSLLYPGGGIPVPRDMYGNISGQFDAPYEQQQQQQQQYSGGYSVQNAYGCVLVWIVSVFFDCPKIVCSAPA